MATQRISFRVLGRVHGVFFRETCVQQGRQLGLSGFVANKRPGEDPGVTEPEVVGWAQGSAADVSMLVAWLWRGPKNRGAHVYRLEVTEEEVRAGDTGGFHREYSPNVKGPAKKDGAAEQPTPKA